MSEPLPARPRLPGALRGRLRLDYERFRTAPPGDAAAHAREGYGVDLTGEYAGRPVKVPFGKASGQLSTTPAEVRGDAEAGLGFVVLKTVIAEDERGARAMAAWAIHETAMRVERRLAASGREGWTVTWKGRGWDRSLTDYLALYEEALDIGARAGMPVAASVKYHLPQAAEAFHAGEYAYTTGCLAAVAGPGMIVEKDFSPTLAGDALAGEREAVLRWIREVPELVKAQAPLALGLKLMNARFDDAFQAAMVGAARTSGADFLVLFNRLLDPERGVAYGGWDLSERNLRVLDGCAPVRHCATGNIISGRVMVEYARRGATAGALHTFFQLPPGAYAASAGSRSARALHALLYDPEEGLIAWLLHLGETGALPRRDGLLHFLDVSAAR